MRAIGEGPIETKAVTFADVWTPMLDSSGAVRVELFLDDGLHLNTRGYDVWTEVLRPLLLPR